MVGKALVERSPTGRWDLWSEMGQRLNPMPPYVPGEFIGSWSYSHGSTNDAYPATVDKSGALSMTRFMEVKTAPTAAKHFLYNKSPYAWVMETGVHPLNEKWKLTPPNRYGAGYGAHMVQLALADSKIFVKTAVTQARNIT